MQSEQLLCSALSVSSWLYLAVCIWPTVKHKAFRHWGSSVLGNVTTSKCDLIIEITRRKMAPRQSANFSTHIYTRQHWSTYALLVILVVFFGKWLWVHKVQIGALTECSLVLSLVYLFYRAIHENSWPVMNDNDVICSWLSWILFLPLF